MTNKWLCQTQNTPCILEFYSITKIHKPTLVGRPITSGPDRETTFVDKLLQPKALISLIA